MRSTAPISTKTTTTTNNNNDERLQQQQQQQFNHGLGFLLKRPFATFAALASSVCSARSAGAFLMRPGALRAQERQTTCSLPGVHFIVSYRILS